MGCSLIENYKYLYRVNPEGFKELFIPMITHYIPIGVSIAYTLLIQLRVTSLRNMMLLNGSGAVLGGLLLYFIIRGWLRINDAKKLLLISKFVMVINRISVFLLLIFPDKWFTPLLLITSVYTGMVTFPLLNSSIQYVVFKRYDLKNKARITNAFLTTFNITVITITFLMSLLYDYMVYIYFLVILFEFISFTTFFKVKGDFTIEHSNIKMIEYFDRDDLKLFLFIFIFSVSLSLISFIKPVVFKSIGEQYVGLLFSIAGILSVIISYYSLKTFTGDNTLGKTFITLLTIGLLFIISYNHPYLQILTILLAPPLISTSSFSYRHLVYTKNGGDSVWTTTAFNEFVRASTNIILPLLAIIPSMNKDYLIVSIGIILLLTSYMIHTTKSSFMRTFN